MRLSPKAIVRWSLIAGCIIALGVGTAAWFWVGSDDTYQGIIAGFVAAIGFVCGAVATAVLCIASSKNIVNQKRTAALLVVGSVALLAALHFMHVL